MSNIRELRIINPNERIDLISALEWVIYEYKLNKGYKLEVKAYSNLPHGQEQQGKEGWVNASDIRGEVGGFRKRISDEVNWPAWSTAISSVLNNKDQKPELFIPVMDLEIDATGSVREDLKTIDSHLISIGLTGVFMRSGDVGSGSYFFVADKPWDYETGFRKFFGLMMVMMLDWQASGEEAKDNRHLSMQLGEKIIKTKSVDEAKLVAQETLQLFPSIPSGKRRPGLEIDPRWAARRFLEEKTYLRYTPGKGYEDKPLMVADLY